MASYTTVSEVAAELGGVTINATSTPSLSQVESWISDASKEIEQLTGRVWSSTSVTSSAYEYHDYDGNGFIRPKHTPIISVESLEYETGGLGASATAWSTLSEGRTENDEFIVYKEASLIKLHTLKNAPLLRAGFQNIRLTYTYGYTSTPVHIKRLCTLLVAKRYIASVANSAASEEGGGVSAGAISVSDPTNYVVSHIGSVNKELEYLKKEVVPTFKTYRIDEADFS